MKLFKYLQRGLVVTVLAAVMALAIQAQTMFILLGTYKGVTYEAEVLPKDVAKTRNVVLEGDNKGFTLITDWKYDCTNRKIKQVHMYVYDTDNKLAYEEAKDGDWMDVKRDTFADMALSGYWCKSVD